MAPRTHQRTRPDPWGKCFPSRSQGLTFTRELQPNGLHPWEFKQFIRLCGMTHVRTSPYSPQSNGKIERWHKSLKGECIRVKTPLCLEDARRLVTEYVEHYNTVRLHSAIGYVTPADRLAGRQGSIWAERKRKLAAAESRRKARHESKPSSTEGGFAASPRSKVHSGDLGGG